MIHKKYDHQNWAYIHEETLIKNKPSNYEIQLNVIKLIFFLKKKN